MSSTLAWTLVGVGIFLLPFILSSLFICAPKWWRRHVSHRLPHTPTPSEVLEPRLPHSLRWLTWDAKPLVEILFLILISPMLLIGALAAAWWSAGVAFVVGKCPYMTSYERYDSSAYREWSEVRESFDDLYESAREKIRNFRQR